MILPNDEITDYDREKDLENYAKLPPPSQQDRSVSQPGSEDLLLNLDSIIRVVQLTEHKVCLESLIELRNMITKRLTPEEKEGIIANSNSADQLPDDWRDKVWWKQSQSLLLTTKTKEEIWDFCVEERLESCGNNPDEFEYKSAAFDAMEIYASKPSKTDTIDFIRWLSTKGRVHFDSKWWIEDINGDEIHLAETDERLFEVYKISTKPQPSQPGESYNVRKEIDWHNANVKMACELEEQLAALRAESQAKDTRIRELEADRDEALKIADDRYDELSRILYNRGEQAIAFIEWVITHPDKWMFSKKLMTWWSPYLSEDKSTKQLFELYIECKKQLTK